MRAAWALAAGMMVALEAPAPARAGAMPPVASDGQVAWSEYDLADPHRAFAIAPGGAWAWVAGQASATAAEQAALAACRERTEQTCLSYAVDDAIIFDRQAWPTLWRLPPAAEAPTIGTRRGQRFPDLAYLDPQGRPRTLGELRGKLVVLHFWASWCPPCLVELPELAKLYQLVADQPDVVFVLLQAREPVSRARGWMTRNGIAMPQSDSGSDGRTADQIRLADGSTVSDRSLAELFPTTYVLGRDGRVQFKSRGVSTPWADYAAFLRDAAAPEEPSRPSPAR